MNSEKIKKQFSTRIREHYDDFLKDWLTQEPEQAQTGMEVPMC